MTTTADEPAREEEPSCEEKARRQDPKRWAIYDRRNKQLDSEQSKPALTPSIPTDAPEVLQELYGAARQLLSPSQPANDRRSEDTAKAERTERWNLFVEGIGAAIREDHLHDPLVQTYLETLRTFGDKKALDRYKNKVGRLSKGVRPQYSHVDLWIAFHSATIREDGASVAQVRQHLLKLLSDHPPPEGMPTDVESLADELLKQKLARHPDLDNRPMQRLLAEIAAIGRIWRVEIMKRLRSDENLRQQLQALGIKAEK